jgi:hypothetical protein
LSRFSQLGLAQAYAKKGDSEAYDDFFATWKDADPVSRYFVKPRPNAESSLDPHLLLVHLIS